MKRHLIALLTVLSGTISGCTFDNIKVNQDFDTSQFTESGSISIARPIQFIPGSTSTQSPGHLLGFMPVTERFSDETQGNGKIWAFIDRASNTLLLQRGDETLLTIRAEVSGSVPHGKYSMIMKQEAPLWYAPEEYFWSRGEEAPIEGSSERFRRGALGDAALFLSEDVSIHSAPINDPAIQGIRLDPEGIANVYRLLPVGSEIVIR